MKNRLQLLGGLFLFACLASSNVKADIKSDLKVYRSTLCDTTQYSLPAVFLRSFYDQLSRPNMPMIHTEKGQIEGYLYPNSEEFYIKYPTLRLPMMVDGIVQNYGTLMGELKNYIAFKKVETDKLAAALQQRITQFGQEAKILPSFYQRIKEQYNGDVALYVHKLTQQSILNNDSMLNRFTLLFRKSDFMNDEGVMYVLSKMRYDMLLSRISQVVERQTARCATLGTQTLFEKAYPELMACSALLTTPQKDKKGEAYRSWDAKFLKETDKVIRQDNVQQNAIAYLVQNLPTNSAKNDEALEQVKREAQALAASSDYFKSILDKDYKGSIDQYVRYVMEHSLITNDALRSKFLAHATAKQLANDAGVKFVQMRFQCKQN